MAVYIEDEESSIEEIRDQLNRKYEISYENLVEFYVNDEVNVNRKFYKVSGKSDSHDVKVIDHSTTEIYFHRAQNESWGHSYVVYISNESPTISTILWERCVFEVDLIPGSKSTKWTLFPFNQTSVLDEMGVMKYLNIDDTDIIFSTEDFEYDEETCESTYSLPNCMKLLICGYSSKEKGIKYLLTQYENELDQYIAGFNDYGSHIQGGDDCTTVFVFTNGSILIYNAGDVSSAAYLEFPKS